MATKQNPGSVYAPDGSLYITLTDGAGNLASVGGSSTVTANSTVTSGFSAGQVLTSDGSKIQASTRGWVTLKQANVEQTVVTGVTTKTTSWSMTIPGGTLGVNGRLRVTWLNTYTGTNSTKITGLDLGSTTFWTGSTGTNIILSSMNMISIANRNSLSSQIGLGTQANNSMQAAAGAANVVGTENTANPLTLAIWITLGNGSDTGAVESVIVEYNNDNP